MSEDNDNIKKLSDVFKDIIKSNQLDDKIRKAKVIAMWSEIVGPHISKNTYNLRFEDNKLIVYVKSDALKNELIFMKNQIIQNIHHHIKHHFIEDIIFY